MIENIYAGEKADNTSEKISLPCKTPKNVRQIGKSGDGLHIYIEDYVKTYVCRLAERAYPECCIAVLIGRYMNTESGLGVFISGAVHVPEAWQESSIVFSEKVWSDVYKTLRTYYTDCEVVGWYYGGPGFRLQEESKFLQAHVDNFADKNKVLLTYDILDKEEKIRLWSPEGFVVQPGYCIYYEKNEEMQNYMMDNQPEETNTEEKQAYTDKDIEELRNYKIEKEQKNDETLVPKKNVSEEAKGYKQMAAVVGLLVMIAIVLVAADILLQNPDILSQQTIAEGDNDSAFGDELAKLTQGITDPGTEITGGAAEAITSGITDTAQAVTGTDIISPSPEGSETAANESTDNANPQTGDNNLPATTIPDNAVVDNSSADNKVADSTDPIADPVTEQAKDDNIADEVIDAGSSSSYVLTRYIVVKGDTLAQICNRYYGGVDKLSVVMELNQIEDRDKIYAGQELWLPIYD